MNFRSLNRQSAFSKENFEATFRWAKIIGIIATGVLTWATLTAGVREMDSRITEIELRGSAPSRAAFQALDQRIRVIEQKQDIGNYLLCRLPPLREDSDCRPNPRPAP